MCSKGIYALGVKEMLLVLLGLTVFAAVMSLTELNVAPKAQHNIRRDVGQVKIKKIVEPVVESAESIVKPVVESAESIVKPVVESESIVKPVVDTVVTGVEKIVIELAVIVLSARDYKKRREVIRETWGNGHSNVFFVVGKHCPYRPEQRKTWECEPKNQKMPIDLGYNSREERLTRELNNQPNVIVVDTVDVYRNLPEKLKLAYMWIVEKTTAKYVLKMDDDSFARVDSVQHWLRNRPNPPKYEIIAGKFNTGGPTRKGKWAETKYKPNKYPPWPSGSGHIVSRSVIKYMHDNIDTWVSYQGEDTSMGIWLSKIREQIVVKRTWSQHFITHSGDCHNTNKFVIGHSIPLHKMRECYKIMDEYKHVTTSQAVCSQGIPMDPFDLVRNHWDIIVKAVYASAYLSSNKIPEKISETYSKLNLAWGGGHEKCDQAHNPTQLTHPNCVPKNSIRDFETSFRSTIDSMNKNGFDSTKGLVPVIPVGNVFFAINGAHRIGAAIATKNLVCVEKVNLREHNWDEKFFRKKNVPNSNIIIRNWANLDKKMIVIIINPKAVMLASKMDQVRKIIGDCSETKSIIFEGNFPVDSGRMQGVLSKAYGDEKWFTNLKLEKYASGFLTKTNPKCKFFVIHGTQENMKNCKLRIRNVFDFKPSGNFKKSCHIGDNYAQHLRMVNYMLSNDNNKRVGQVIKTDKPENVWDTIISDISIQSNIDWSGKKTASKALYSRTIYLNNQGVKSLVQHVFDEKNIPIHLDTNDHLKPITVSFFNSKQCKQNCLTHIQSIVLAQMTLNDNSIMFLNRHGGKNCKDVAYELASRFGLKPAVGTFFQFPSGIMIDSGAVMSFFGMRKRTDIDILFQNKIDKTVLGWENNILIEAHAFNSNKIGNGRAWGEEHISPSRSVNDLFTNPKNYGYCHGVKFVSLQQLVRYKTRRAEPNKDDKDVAQIKNFLNKKESKSSFSRVWVCGSDWNYPILAKMLFGKPAELLKDNTNAGSNDILVYGVGSYCRNLGNFPGYILTMNGESRRSHTIKSKKQFFIGPWVETYHTKMVYNVARRYLSLMHSSPEWFTSNSMPARLENTGEYFAIYASRNCKSHRDDAFKKLNGINTVHVSGKCPANGEKTKSPYATLRSDMEMNPKLYSHYKFVLCMENKKESGYITEKILYAFFSGAIPIYYGTEEVFDIFNKKAFVYYDINNPQKALDLISHLNENEEAYRNMVSQPIFVDSTKTLEKYFSLDDKIGSGKLKNQILDMMGIVPDKHTDVKVPKIHRGSGNYNLDKPTGKKEGTYSWSQYDQDSVVDNILKQKRDGFFLEIGGYDGELHSNTLFFERQRGWDGLLVEANPFTFKQMLSRHRTCGQVHSCISNTLKSMDFKIAGGITSSVQTISQKHSNRIKEAIKVYGKNKQWEGAGNVVTTNCYTLSSILETMGVTHVDYFSLDVEGGEVHILNSIDFNKISFGVISIEVQVNREQIYKIMMKNGYKRVKSLHIDDFYIHT